MTWSRGNTILGRIEADWEYPFARIKYRDDGGCMAVLKLGVTWARSGRSVMCSRRAIPGELFCGQHDHLNALWGGHEDYLQRAFDRQYRRGNNGLIFEELGQ